MRMLRVEVDPSEGLIKRREVMGWDDLEVAGRKDCCTALRTRVRRIGEGRRGGLDAFLSFVFVR